ncbi:MAG: hypothetical protein QME32_00045 [Endomicrobiia bacterium]|nr:hypothetical protein [Endomicrobiia bacterium]
MSEENKQEIIMECRASYSLSDEASQTAASNDAQVILKEENIVVMPKFGEPLFFSLRDILEISGGDYKIYLALTSKERLTIFNLGYKHEDFMRVLSRLRNEIILKDMLMQETLKKSAAEAEFVYFDDGGNEKQRGKCEPRLYETALVLIPEKGELVRIPYSDILEICGEDFILAMTTDFGEKFVFSKMGGQFDPFAKTLSDSINELSLKVQSSLKDLLPKSDPSVIRRAARLMKEGKAARRSDIESISPELWTELEKKLEVAGIKEEYDFLKSLAQEKKMCIGLKRGLLGDLTGEYIWFLIPMYSKNPDEPGNAVAMEAISGEGAGKATYFFRIASRKDYPNFKNIEDLHKETDNFTIRINRCMLAINFRREPIYLPDERLKEPQYQKYNFAIAKIPALRELRHLFIGRVIHSSTEQWKKDVMDLLKFNVTSNNDLEKWTKRGIDNVPGFVTELDFDPDSLADITDSPDAEKMLRDDPTETVIPPRSKIRFNLEAFCLDEGKPGPEAEEPCVFGYEMRDIPMYLKILKYFSLHPEVGHDFKQKLIWNLARKPNFEEISEDETKFLFLVDDCADAEVNNHKSVKYEEWRGIPSELWPEKIIPQPIPGTNLCAKLIKTEGFSGAEIEIYNPADEPQKFTLLKSNPGAFSAKSFNSIRQIVIYNGRGKFRIKSPTFVAGTRG